jgi:hypothetical protein
LTIKTGDVIMKNVVSAKLENQTLGFLVKHKAYSLEMVPQETGAYRPRRGSRQTLVGDEQSSALFN